MTNEEAWNKFMQTGRVDYYLLSRGINVYKNIVPSQGVEADRATGLVGGERNEFEGLRHSAEGTGLGRQG